MNAKGRTLPDGLDRDLGLGDWVWMLMVRKEGTMGEVVASACFGLPRLMRFFLLPRVSLQVW